MKNVGIITFHCANNFGAVLQVYALMETIQRLGLNCEVIDFKPQNIVQSYSTFIDFKYYIKQRGLIRSIKLQLVKLLNYKSNTIKTRNFNNFRNEYLQLSNKTFYKTSELFNYCDDYDYCITGSDQVWNPQFTQDYTDAFFLKFVSERTTTISYAASTGLELDTIKYNYYKELLRDIEKISVREKSAKKFVDKLTNRKVEVVLDPVFLLGKNHWNELIKSDMQKRDYILVYDIASNPNVIEIANKIAREKDLDIISYSRNKAYINWEDSFSTDTPNAFLGLIKGARYVITSSFHGTAFAIIFNKHFYTVPHLETGNRMIDLLEDLSLTDRLIKRYDNSLNLNTEIDYDRVNTQLDMLRKKSLDFLTSSLNVDSQSIEKFDMKDEIV